jgi:G3E family GTPase
MIRVTVLTGFLGSGKTTLLGQLLRSPQFSRTAVIINEFGEIGLDHELVETSEESFVELETGCLCCTVRDDLARTLADILRRRDEGSVAPFERVVIETSGLADPAPILHVLMTDTGLAQRLCLAGVITLVDAVNGLSTLARQPESVKQAAIADRLVLTKTDLVDRGEVHALVERLAAINPCATVLTASFGEIDSRQLFDLRTDAQAGEPRELRTVHRFTQDDRNGGPTHDHRPHDLGISCFAIVREEPIRAITLTLLLEVLAEHCGGDLLRLKGLVNVSECPERPAVIHGVQHVFHPPTWLDSWPSEDRRSRLLFVGRGIPQAWVVALLDALEVEVGEVARGTAPAA